MCLVINEERIVENICVKFEGMKIKIDRVLFFFVMQKLARFGCKNRPNFCCFLWVTVGLVWFGIQPAHHFVGLILVVFTSFFNFWVKFSIFSNLQNFYFFKFFKYFIFSNFSFFQIFKFLLFLKFLLICQFFNFFKLFHFFKTT